MIGLLPCNRIPHLSTPRRRPLSRRRNAFRPAVETLEARLTPAVTFAAQQTFAVGTDPRAVAVGDFNGDGRPDLAVPNYGGATVSVLLDMTAAGAAAAAFAAQQTFAAGADPIFVAVGDVNGDGRPDLAVANDTGTVSVLLNTTPAGAPFASFAAPQTFAVGLDPSSVAVGDFNGDGRPDLAVANFNQTAGTTVSLLLNTTPAGSATTSFATQQTFAVGLGPEVVAAGDFNGDGRPDLAVINYNDRTVSVLLDTTAAGATTASFAARQTFAAGTDPTSLAVGDFNGDGRPDLAVANSGDKTVSVLLDTTPAGATTATFAAQQTFAAGTEPEAVVVGDFNGDGRPDLAVPNNLNGNTVSVLPNTTAAGSGTVSFAARQTFAVGSGPEFVAAADVNGDGRADLAVVNTGDKTVSVLLDATAPFASTTPVVVGQFGGTGVWEFNQAFDTWVQLTPANASHLAADPQGDIAGEFPGSGVWLYRPAAGWKQIGTGDASLLAMDALGDVAGEFPGAGVWLFRPAVGFKQIGSGDASALAMDAQGDVVGTFPGAGVWLFRPAIGFQKIGTSDAAVLTMDALGDVIGTFPRAGVWEYSLATSFRQIGTADATALAADPLGNVVASFAGVVSLYQPNVGWRPFLPVAAAALGMDALGDVFGAFAGAGVWETGDFRLSTQLRTSDAAVLVVA